MTTSKRGGDDEKWTRGPWRVESDWSVWSEEMKVADVRGWSHLTVRMKLDEDQASIVSLANARLIAAAPEMFEALEAALKLLDPGAWDPQVGVAVRAGTAVLEKARGVKP